MASVACDRAVDVEWLRAQSAYWERGIGIVLPTHFENIALRNDRDWKELGRMWFELLHHLKRRCIHDCCYSGAANISDHVWIHKLQEQNWFGIFSERKKNGTCPKES